MLRISAALLVIAFLMFGCATFFTGATDTITLQSSPNANYKIFKTNEVHIAPEIRPRGRLRYKIFETNGVPIAQGVTPSEIRLNKDGEYTVEIYLEGYKKQSFFISKEFNAVSVLNLGNVLFWAIDYLTGAMFRLNPTYIRVDLDTEAYGGDNPQIKVSVFDGKKKVHSELLQFVPEG